MSRNTILGQATSSPGPDDRSGRTLVVRPPARRIRRLAQLWFSKTTYTTVFEPILHEFCTDYCDALAAGDLVRARFVVIRGYGSFWLAVVARLPVSLFKLIALLWKHI